MNNFKPNLLVVCGSGRKVGKTTIARGLIEYFSKIYNVKIAAIKVSPHFHKDKQPKNKIFQDSNCNVYIENGINSKDSSLFLQAGAEPSYYVETKDNKLEKAFNFILNNIGDNRLIICESGVLGRLYKPGLLVFVDNNLHNNVQDNNKIINKSIADIIVVVENGNFEKELEILKNKISFSENKWILC